MKQKRSYLIISAITLVLSALLLYSCDGITTANNSITITGLSLDSAEITVKLTSTAQLAATVEPDEASEVNLVWTSSDENIVTISEEGIATAAGVGTATVSVETEDGSFSAEATVTVTPIMFGTTVGSGSLGTSKLYEIDSETGAQIALIGDTGYYINGLAYDNDSGILYGTTRMDDPNLYSGLVTINTSTAAVTEIGSPGIEGSLLTPAFDSSGTLYAWRDDSSVLVTVNTSTAALTDAGESGIYAWSHSMDFDSSGTLFLVNPEEEDESFDAVDLFSVNTSTGAASLVTGINTDTEHTYALNGKFNPLTDLMWSLDYPEWDDDRNTRTFNVLNISSGTRTDTVATLDYLHAIAFRSK